MRIRPVVLLYGLVAGVAPLPQSAVRASDPPATVGSHAWTPADWGTVIGAIVASHRDLFRFILSDETLTRELASAREESPQQMARAFLGTLLINHQSEVFSHYRSGDIAESDWEHMVSDMRGVFRWPPVALRWRTIKGMYGPEFRDFVDGELLKSSVILSPTASQGGVMRAPLKMLSGDPCGDSTCPAVFETESGSLVVQGKVLDAILREQMNLPAGEDAVEIPRDVVLRAFAGK
jgi:hypothetical protein